MATLNLSNVHPDQEDIRIQLEQYLNNTDSWKGVVTSQTGQGILNMIAAIGAFDQAKIRRKFEDSFPETVVSDRAAYAISAMQGVRLTRKLPASITVNLKSASLSQTIPAYTVFQGAGAFFFNREAIFLQADTPASATLFEGNVLRYSMPGLDQPYAMFVSPELAFTVSDVDVEVRLNDAPMARSTGGLWKMEGQLGFVDSTLPDGKLMLQFGNSKFGGQPGTNDMLYITYVTTNGSDGNSLDCLGKGITCPAYATVTGSFISNPIGGANERSALAYKNIAAPTFGVFNSAITKQQYISTALQFPGVVDVITFAQREVNPSALEWMNLIKIVLYTSSDWDDFMRQEFLDHMHSNSAYSPRFFLENPQAELVDINIDIYCYNWTNSTQAKLNATAAIQALFTPRIGMLNYDLHLSDIINAAKDSDPGIEYVILNKPVDDVLISGSPVPAPTLTLIPNGGNLSSDTYYYGIQVTTNKGVIAIRNLGKITAPANSAVKIDWIPITDAVTYQVFRKDTASQRPGLVAEILATHGTSFTDTNMVAPGVTPAPQNTVPVRYVKANSLVVTDHYSVRSVRN